MRDFFVSLLDGLQKFFTIVIPLIAGGTIAIDEIHQLVAWLTLKIGNLVMAELGGTDFTAISGIDWSVVNAIVPLTEGWSMILAYLTFMGTVLTIRWIKSLLPSVSN